MAVTVVPAWQSVSVAAEIIALVCEKMGQELVANPVRVCFPDSHTPTSAPLEAEFYPDDAALHSAVQSVLAGQPA